MNIMREYITLLMLLLSSVIFPLTTSYAANAVPAPYQQMERILGRNGDFKDNVFRIEMPRNDIAFSLEDKRVPASFGLTGSISVTRGTRGVYVMMGEWVLLRQELNPVLSSLLQNGFQVTAIHNHFLWDAPRIIFLHMQGTGSNTDLANRIKRVLAVIGHTSPPTWSPDERTTDGTRESSPPLTLDTKRLDQILGRKGQQQEDGVYQYSIDRSDIKLSMNGARITERMGLHIEAQFMGTNERAMMATEMALLPAEVQPVLRVFRAYGIPVSAIHNHMIGTTPEILFVHTEANGTAVQLATALSAAIRQTGLRR
jgi:hypothetical protein